MGVGNYLKVCVWDYRGIISESCLAHGIIIQLNNITIKAALWLATQIP